MNIMPNLSLTLFKCSLLITYFCGSCLLAQRNYTSDYTSIQGKPVVEYYENIDDKSFYQQKRIYGMKGELNNYSEKLHNLQDRFDKIFYGLSSHGNFKTPFDTSNQPARPVFDRTVEPSAPVVENFNASIINNPVEPVPSENQLAFNVDSAGTFTKDDQVVSTFNPKQRNGLGHYFVLRPGVSFPHKIHKTTRSYKRYDPGFTTNISGGFTINRFKIGLGGGYKVSSFHDSSKLNSPLKQLTGDSKTFAGYLDIGYSFNVVSRLEAYLGVGVGYYLSLIEDRNNLNSRKEHDIFLTGSTGVAIRFSEWFSLSLGYRYFHEDEVPAHISELGLNFEF
jgi:opacity protein-like surface antigen